MHYATHANSTAAKLHEDPEPQHQLRKKSPNANEVGSPMAILKRFKMLKRITQQQNKKATLTTVEDDTVNEQDLVCDEDA